MTGPAGPRRADDRHYSYAHYADRQVAEGFDALRFSGPIGRLLLDVQERLLVEALEPGPARRVVDVGTGTGRAAIGLATAGAIGDWPGRVARDAPRGASGARRPRARQCSSAWLTRMHLPLADRSVDGAVCLRVLMHAIDWRQCVAELCRVARWRVVVDFPALGSVAALESGVRRVRQRLGQPVEAYRVLAERDVRAAFAAHGFRVVIVRRQFVLPINLHKTTRLDWRPPAPSNARWRLSGCCACAARP